MTLHRRVQIAFAAAAVAVVTAVLLEFFISWIAHREASASSTAPPVELQQLEGEGEK